MKSTTKRLFAAVAAAVILGSGGVRAETVHQWYNGYVDEVAPGLIKVDRRTFRVNRQTRVVKHVKRRGAVYEEPARLDELRRFDRVTVKDEDGVAMEIIIEKYR
ncbi:MAG TPA: hypothetical protein ENJ37_02575 [Deltaproteobacteria bacterium]|nr:hypothetical protein [Deltaproteobacteria bacterium]